MVRWFALVYLVACVPVAFAQRQYGFDNRKSSGQPYLSPEETVRRIKVAEGFEVKLFAGEPMLANPIAFTVDERGRLWVVECFEYPSRTPAGKMPRDRIVILEDTDGDGLADKRTVFAEGKDFPERFDLASGIEVGHGGVFVGAPPNLWFIENRNDKPGQFSKLLSGFGSQDTHETLNTFQWGPDGWLYGLHGIYTQSKVVGKDGADSPPIELNAGLWRYDPRSRRFEVVSEGTSNPWGWDYRNTDGQTIAACCVIPHLFHLVPGGNYRRQSGQSFNPFVYGQIGEICDHTFHKESGWAHAGLISLDTPLIPAEYRDSVIFGSIHGCSIKRNVLKPNGSTFVASRADDFLTSGDKNVRPINLRWGPNGEIYLIDWHDQNPCHQAEAGSWDYERGRVYRIQPKGLTTRKALDLGSLPMDDLMARVKDPNPYVVRTALRLMDERRDQLTADQRAKLAAQLDPVSSARLGLEGASSSWKLPERATWVERCKAVRALGTRQQLDAGTMSALVELARTEASPMVRRELASLAALRGRQQDFSGLVHALATHAEDAGDPVLPQLLWLAFEPRLMANPAAECQWLAGQDAKNALVIDVLLPRSVRRLVAHNDFARAIELVGRADSSARRRGLEGLMEAVKGRVVDAPEPWKKVQPQLANDPDQAVRTLARSLAVHFSDREATETALAALAASGATAETKFEALRVIAMSRPDRALPNLLELVQNSSDENLRVEAIRALAGYNSAEVGQLARNWSGFSPKVRAEIVNLLATRKNWAKALIEGLENGTIDRSALNSNIVRRIQAFKDAKLNKTIELSWGRLRDTPEELAKLIDRMRLEIDAAPGSFAMGKSVFDANCAKCHQFEGRGHSVGPALDGAGRDPEYLLANILDPNRVVGAPYFIRRVLLKNGRLEEGLLHAEDPQTVTLKGENDALKVLPRADIESVEVAEKSVMPEGLAYSMTTQDFRDLVRYLQASPAIAAWQVGSAAAPASQLVELGASGQLTMQGASATAKAEFNSAAEFKTRLVIATNSRLRVTFNGQDVTPPVEKQAPQSDLFQADLMQIDVAVVKGPNQLSIQSQGQGGRTVLTARLLDPERKLTFPEPKAR